VLTSKRATIIASINEVEGARSEELWLAEYEGDAQRYQGRDANKKLQRAIRAAKLRDRLPQAISDLHRLLDEWKESEGEVRGGHTRGAGRVQGHAYECPALSVSRAASRQPHHHPLHAPIVQPPQAFLFDGRDYAFERLDGLAVEVEAAAAARAAAKAAATSKRRQSLAGEGATSPGSSRSSAAGGRLIGPTPRKAGGAGAPPTPPASRVSSSATRRVGGPATPMALRGVSNRSISERHSICVVRCVGAGMTRSCRHVLGTCARGQGMLQPQERPRVLWCAAPHAHHVLRCCLSLWLAPAGTVMLMGRGR
jgi:hypothetical protein